MTIETLLALIEEKGAEAAFNELKDQEGIKDIVESATDLTEDQQTQVDSFLSFFSEDLTDEEKAALKALVEGDEDEDEEEEEEEDKDEDKGKDEDEDEDEEEMDEGTIDKRVQEAFSELDIEVVIEENTLSLSGGKLEETVQLDLAQENIKRFIKKNKAMSPEDLKKLLNLVTEETLQDTLTTKLQNMSEEDLKKLDSIINDPIEFAVKSASKGSNVAEETEVDLDSVMDQSELSEEFKEQAKIVFEAAVSEKVETKVEAIKEDFETRLREGIEANHEEIADKVDGFLTTVIEQWMEENDEVITSKLRTDIAESFISNLKDIFESHYIEIPETKVDEFSKVADQAAQLEAKVEQYENEIEELTEKYEQTQREKLIAEAGEGLFGSKFDKLKKLAENIEFVDNEAFAKKLEVIKENFINGTRDTEPLKESADRTVVTVKDDDGEIDDKMGSYVEALNRL